MRRGEFLQREAATEADLICSRDLEDLEMCANDAHEAHMRIEELVRTGESRACASSTSCELSR